MNAIEEFEIYRAYKKDPNNILNEQLEFKSYILYDKIIDNTNIDYTPQHNNRERSSKLCSTLSTRVSSAHSHPRTLVILVGHLSLIHI